MALPNSDIMIHQPAVHGGGIKVKATDIKIMSDHIQRSKRRLNKILAANTGQPVERLEQDTERDNLMSAQEALDYGLIDKIMYGREG